MIPLFSSEQVRNADDFAINSLGIPAVVLMENASREIAQRVKEYAGEPQDTIIGIICGKGNNGGDGFAAARHLSNDGYNVIVVYLGSEREMKEDCLANFKIIKALSRDRKNLILRKFSSLKDLNLFKKCGIIIDAMLGSGASGTLREPYKKIVNFVNSLRSFKVAVDIPTGLDSDKGYGEMIFKSDLTISLGELKKGLFFGEGYSSCGRVLKGDIGTGFSFFDKFPVFEYLIEPEDVFNSLPEKRRNIHKYSAGKVLTIGGSSSLPGAAALAARATMKIGAGASIVAFPKSARELIHKELEEVIVNSYEDGSKGYLSSQNIPEFVEKIEWADTVALGPGLGRAAETQEAVIKLLKERKFRSVIVDADALFALANYNYSKLNIQDFILTPHYGEFSKLIDVHVQDLKKDILKYGKQFVKSTGCRLVLKGAPTIIFLPDGECLINSSGNPGLAKFGTGDVLTGVLAGLSAQQKDIEKSLIAGVYLHSFAADLLSAELSVLGYTASDIIEKLPSAINFLRSTFA